MMLSKAKTRITSVRRNLAQARESLLASTPEEIEQAEPALADAIQTLTKLEQSLDAGPKATPREKAEFLDEMQALRLDLLKLAALSHSGLEFCHNWSNVLKSAAGYLADGTSAARPEPASTIALEG